MLSFQNCSRVKEQRINTFNFRKIWKATEGSVNYQTAFYCLPFCRLLFNPLPGRQAGKPPTLLAGGLFCWCVSAKNQVEQGWSDQNPKAETLPPQLVTKPVTPTRVLPFQRTEMGSGKRLPKHDSPVRYDRVGLLAWELIDCVHLPTLRKPMLVEDYGISLINKE